MISIKLLCNFIEITHRHGWSPLTWLHIFRIPFVKNTSGWLLLTIAQFTYRIGFSMILVQITAGKIFKKFKKYMTLISLSESTDKMRIFQHILLYFYYLHYRHYIYTIYYNCNICYMLYVTVMCIYAY